MSPVKRKTWNQSEYFRQMPIVGGTLTECVLDLPESSAAERGRVGTCVTSQVTMGGLSTLLGPNSFRSNRGEWI
jgi:hypothetical protein